MSIKSWPVTERPRERLLQHGAQVLSDAELLAIFLRTGSAQASAIDMARQLIVQFGSLANLLNAPQQQLLACHGMGEAKLAHLLAALELGRRYVAQQLQVPQQLNQPALVKQYVSQQLKCEAREVFAVVCLNSQLQLIHFAKLFYGTITRCTVYVQEVVRTAIEQRAVNLIIAHNHPDSDATPSAADIELTRQLHLACRLLDICLVDHIIVGRNQTLALSEHGFMPDAAANATG